MKIALLKCPSIEPSFPDIALGYFNAVLKNEGHEVFIFDLNIDFFNLIDVEERKKWFTSNLDALFKQTKKIIDEIPAAIDSYAKKIADISPRVVGFSVWNSNVYFSLQLAEKIKDLNKDIMIIFGGPKCFPLRGGEKLARDKNVDIVVYGEGEHTLKDIVNSIEKSGETKTFPGTITKCPQGIIDHGFPKQIEDLDALPFPDYRDFRLELYPERYGLYIFFNRGCINKCVYCSVSGTYPLFRFRSASSIFEEMKYQVKQHPQISNFGDASPALNANIKQLNQLCELIISSDLHVAWGGQAMIRSDMSEELIKKMKKAGCSNLSFGMESGSQKVLEKMGKPYKVEDAELLLRRTYDAGIKNNINFIIGFPEEDPQDFYKTLEFITRNKKYLEKITSSATCWLEPYSYLYNHPEEFGIDCGEKWDNNFYLSWFKGNKNTLKIRKIRKEIFDTFTSGIGRKPYGGE